MILNPYAIVIDVYATLGGKQPGAASYADHKAYINANGQAAYLTALEGMFATQTNAQMSTTILGNLGLASVFTAAQGEAYLAANAGNRVKAALDLASALTNYVSDATNTNDAAILAAKTTYVATTANAYTYASNAANTADAATSSAAVSTGQTFTLTTSVDSVSATSANDTIAASIVNGGTSTLNAGDVIVGGDGADNLSIVVTKTDDVAAVAVQTAVQQVNTYSIPLPDGGTSVVGTLNYGGISTAYTTGTTAALHGAALAAAINQSAGQTIAVFTAPTAAEIQALAAAPGSLVVTAPTAGTALPAITLSAALTVNVPTVTFTTPNTAGVTAVDGVSLTSAVTVAAADVSGIETVTVTNTGGAATLDATTYSGVTEFVSNVSTGANTFNDIGTANLTIVGDDIVTNGATSFRSSDTASVTDALTLNIRDGVNAGDITSTDANDDWTSVTINVSGGTATATTAANVVGALDLGAGDKITTVTINAEDSLTMTSLVGFDTTTAGVANKASVVVTGDSQVTLGTLDAAVETLNASASTGSIRFTASTQTDFQFLGGSGDDRVTTNAVLSTSVTTPGSIDAGAGSADRLIVTDSTHITETVGAKYAGFEQLQVANAVTVDMDHLATNNSIDTIRLTTGGAVNDMSAAQALNVTVTAGGNNPTLTVKNGATLGQVDTVKITATDELATTATIALGTPVLTGVEKLELVATDNITIAALTGATSLDTITITGSKTVGITSGTSFGNTNQLVDASQATGVQTLNFTGATAAVRILGGSAGDTITVAVDVANVINGGGGLDTIAIGLSDAADVESDVTSTADYDHITGFDTTANDLDYNGALSNGAGSTASGIAATEIGSSTTLAAALAAAGAGDDIVFIATTDIGAASATALDALVAGKTVALAQAAIAAVAANTFNAVAGLDAVLGANDFALVQISTDSDTFVFRVNNFSTTVADSLTADEISLVGVFVTVVDLVAGDYI